MFGLEGGIEHLSLWDADHDGIVSRDDMVNVLLDIFEDRDDFRLTIENRTPLARGSFFFSPRPSKQENFPLFLLVLTTVLAVLLGIPAVIIVLLVYGINPGDILLPILGMVLPLAFIFGRAFQQLFESFLVLFVVRPWAVGDLIVHAGTFLEVREVSLYVSTGFDPTGRWVSVPNASAINSLVVNYGRCRPTRLRVFIRVEPLVVGKEKYVLKQMAAYMKAYCERHPKLYAKQGFTAWQEQSGPQAGAGGEFDDVRYLYLCFNCALARLNEGQFSEIRKVRTKFLTALRKALSKVAARGLAANVMTVQLEGVSLGDTRNTTIDL